MVSRTQNQKILCIYHFFDGGIESRTNLAHFLAFGLHDDLDVHLLVSGEPCAELLEMGNVTTHVFANHNLDFGAISSFLEAKRVNLSEYDAALVVNSSVRGPFCSPNQSKPWFRLITDKLNSSVVIAGPTVNELPSGNRWSGGYELVYGQRPHLAHVQTYCYAISIDFLQALLEFGFFSPQDEKPKLDVIRDYEIRMSGLALELGFQIDSLLPGYGPLAAASNLSGNDWAQNGDPVVNGGYFGRTLHPYEVLFVKTNRGMYSSALLDSLCLSMILDHRDVESESLARDYLINVLSAAKTQISPTSAFDSSTTKRALIEVPSSTPSKQQDFSDGAQDVRV